MKNRYHLPFCFLQKKRWFSTRAIPVFLFFLLFLSCITNAQSNAALKEAHQRMEKTAAGYFEQDDLVDAYPLYSQLLSIYPHDPTYNYRLGACMLYANGDKKKAIKYILYALKQSSSVDNLAYYYLGRAMHLNYEFDQAIRYYLKFQEVASSGELKKYPVTRLVEMCRNAKELLASSQELDVLRKKSLSSSIFWEAYSMRTNGGTLITEPEEFKSKIDKKNKLVNLMYLTPGKKEAFFSSYGNSEDNGKDIYVIRKKADGTWGTAESLGPVINTSFDEDYPVYDAPRSTLYFCSKGHNSMGGYDIFSSVYNDTTQTWSDPVNLDFPINTPDDDILLVPDTSGQFAFFASARSSPQGKIEVYKIALHLHPPGTVVVAGRVSTSGASTPAYSVIAVRDSATNRIVAIDTTSSQDGGYSFNLSKGKKYVFTIEDSAHHSQTKSVVLAAGETDRAVEQNIELDPSGAVKIENHAAIVSPDSSSRLALQFIKNAAQMEVNVDTNSSIQTLIAQSRANNSNNQTSTSTPAVSPAQNIATTTSSSPEKTSLVNPSNNNDADITSTALAENNNNSSNPKEVPVNNPSNNASGNNNPVAANNGSPVNKPIMPEKSATDSLSDGNVNDNNNIAVVANNAAVSRESSKDIAVNNNPGNTDSTGILQQNNNTQVQTQPSTRDNGVVTKGNSDKLNSANSESNQSNAVSSNNGSLAPSNATPVSNNADSTVQGNVTPAVKNNASAPVAKVDSVKIEQLQQDKQQLNDKATIAIGYASDQIEHTQRLQKKLDARMARKKHNKDSIAILSNEVKEAAQKVVDAYRLAAQYKNGARDKQSEINQVENGGANANVQENQAGGGNAGAKGVYLSPGDLMRQQVEQVKDDSAQLANDNSDDAKQINELDKESADFLDQARQATDTAQRNALLQQVDDLSKSKATKQEEINENDAQLQQLHNEYAWLNTTSQKIDSISPVSDNSTDMANINTALQKEIDTYAAKSANDSTTTGNEENRIATNKGADSPAGISNAKHGRHSHKKNSVSAQPVTENNIAANNSPPANDANMQDTNSIVANTTENVPSEATNNNGTKQSPKVDNNNPPPAVVNTSAKTDITPAPVSLKTIYHPDSSGYYKAPGNALLDSLANATPVATGGQSPPLRTAEQLTASSISTVQYNDDMAGERAQKAQQYFAAASQLADAAKKLHNEIKHEPDKTKAAQLSAKADSLDALTFQLNLRGTEIVAKANSVQYSANVIQLKNITAQSPDSADKATIARLKLKDAQDSYNTYTWERDSAYSSSIPTHKQQYMEAAVKDLAVAIIKQQTAIYLYKQADSARGAGSPAVAANTNSINSANEQHPAASPDNNASENNPVVSVNEPAKDINSAKASPAKDNKNQESSLQPTPDNSNQPASVQPSSQPDNTQPALADNDKATIESAPEKAINVKTKPAESAPASNEAAPASSGNTSVASSAETTPIFKPAEFTNANSPTYSAAKPIPIDPALPQGLIFGVQVGAFRNPILPGLFKGFEPIIGLKTPEGVVRYIAGTFKTFEPAKDAAAKIRNLGYAGAFVVAYYNGKRISIKDALAMLGVPAPPVAVVPEASQTIAVTREKSPPLTETSNETIQNEKPPVFSGKATVPDKRDLIDNRRRDIKAIKDSVPPAADNISEIKGLVYTVQVGSFSKRKGFTRLQKIKHLYYWAGSDGTIKYNSGVYTNLADARAAKDIIVANTAVKDAFVTAYYKGQRITSQQAAGLLGNVRSPVVPPPVTNNNASHPAEDKTIEEEPGNSFAAASRDKVIYTVRIASFTGKLPVDTVNKLLTHANEGIEPHKEDGGITTYYAGMLTDYESAEVLRQKFLNGGFSQATVVAFYRGKKISVQEARSIKNQ